MLPTARVQHGILPALDFQCLSLQTLQDYLAVKDKETEQTQKILQNKVNCAIDRKLKSPNFDDAVLFSDNSTRNRIIVWNKGLRQDYYDWVDCPEVRAARQHVHVVMVISTSISNPFLCTNIIKSCISSPRR